MATCLSFFSYLFCDLRSLHSFPTRRSSDLVLVNASFQHRDPSQDLKVFLLADYHKVDALAEKDFEILRRIRSEEHTSELQSLTNLVCRLPLEKKNKSRSTSTSTQ